VDWSSAILYRSTAYVAVKYRIEGVAHLRLPLSIGQYVEGRVGPGLIRYVFYPPEWRVQIGCAVGYRDSVCYVEEGYLVTNTKDFFFMIESNEEWWIALPRWMGPPPPGPLPSLEGKRPLGK
jgi:hypothetical protein